MSTPLPPPTTALKDSGAKLEGKLGMGLVEELAEHKMWAFASIVDFNGKNDFSDGNLAYIAREAHKEMLSAIDRIDPTDERKKPLEPAVVAAIHVDDKVYIASSVKTGSRKGLPSQARIVAWLGYRSGKGYVIDPCETDDKDKREKGTKWGCGHLVEGLDLKPIKARTDAVKFEVETAPKCLPDQLELGDREDSQVMYYQAFTSKDSDCGHMITFVGERVRIGWRFDDQLDIETRP
ncbi:hypothetical protein CC80DRAFT_557041 [Byssothecium circinans]|uniref:Uncharacterized protein n=1 Tax=Byssothecium circinans TaxID=147558 RepID=A0A6A5UEU3_9PLEO|nr:hypothetical protein CC80DRAFT_557041 [Byssothecium circinans]